MKKLRRFILSHFVIHILRFYWKTFKPCGVGVRVIVQNTDKKILFVKHSYKKGWYLPGGSLKTLERAEVGGRREVKEETNIEIKDIRFQGIYRGIEDAKNDWVLFFYAKPVDTSTIEIDHVEIDDYKWMLPDEIVKSETDRRSYRAITEMGSKCPIYHLDI